MAKTNSRLIAANPLPILATDEANDPTATNTVDRSRFGIGEWYGRSFTDLTPDERKDFADYTLPSGVSMPAADRERLLKLRAKSVRTIREEERLATLENAFTAERNGTKPCPFKQLDGYGPTPCTKPGGVCSLRLYEQNSSGAVQAVAFPRGALRATCPSRFHESTIAFRWASREILGQSSPALVGEVGFLESSETYDGAEGEDVGRIDMVVVDNTKPADYPLPWIALEVQAVYFSGAKMSKLFKQITDDIKGGGTGVVFPADNRRPDYRSSGPKRLMPQLQIKVPTLRRWGKKMAIVVDRPFYQSMGVMETVADVSNSDVAWFVVDFIHDAANGCFKIAEGDAYFMTLEEAVTGLTGGTPVTLKEFEIRIGRNLGKPD